MAGGAWLASDVVRVRARWRRGDAVASIASEFGRSISSIRHLISREILAGRAENRIAPVATRDLVGQRFGKRLVIGRAGISSAGDALFVCRCACGKESVVEAFSLKCGKRLGCPSCASRDRRGMPRKKAPRQNTSGLRSFADIRAIDAQIMAQREV